MYVDRARRVAIRFEESGPGGTDDAGVEPGTKTRTVRTRAELEEKVRLADAGLDDRVVECLKLVLALQEPALATCALEFEGAAPDALVFLADGDAGPIPVTCPRRAYDDYLALLASRGLLGAPRAWERVDCHFAARLIEALAGPAPDVIAAPPDEATLPAE